MNLYRNILLIITILVSFSYSGFAQDSADVKLTPSEEKVYIEQARKSVENESYDAAIKKLNLVIKSSDDNYEALDLRGVVKNENRRCQRKIKR